MKKLIHTPEGMRDLYGRECDKKRYLESRIDKLFRSYGYQSIETPTLEFAEVFDEEVGTTPSRELYKLFDRDGNMLVLRPDFTPPVARAASMYFAEEKMPLRLCYRGSVYSNKSGLRGQLRESAQLGVEYLNDDSPEADAEIIALVVSAMRTAGLSDFQVTVGHADFFTALAEEANLDRETISELQSLLAAQNRFGAQELIARTPMRQDLRYTISQMPELFGDVSVLARAEQMVKSQRALAAVERLRRIDHVLRIYGVEQYVTYDLGMITEYRYYTGIIFQAYTYGTGDALIRGGRYDRLIEHFGKRAAAIGFAVFIDSMLMALDRQKINLPIADIKTMVLYPANLEPLAIRFAADLRAKKLDVALVRFEPGRILDDYSMYGRRNQFGGIIYFRSEREVYSINLGNNHVDTVDITPFLQQQKPDGTGEGMGGAAAAGDGTQQDKKEDGGTQR